MGGTQGGQEIQKEQDEQAGCQEDIVKRHTITHKILQHEDVFYCTRPQTGCSCSCSSLSSCPCPQSKDLK